MVTHPDFYHGLVGVASVWEVAFLITSRDLLRYCQLMPAIFLDKLLYPAAALLFWAEGRMPTRALSGAKSSRAPFSLETMCAIWSVLLFDSVT